MLPSSREPIRRWQLFVIALVVLSLPCLAYSQVLYGSLTGNVRDQSGAVVATGAKVQALNVATNVAKATTTDGRGNYLFSDLLPGTYTVTVEAAGFKTLVTKNVRIVTNATQRVDAQLEITKISETVEVTAAPAALQTDRSDLHITQSARQVNDLPLGGSLGRNYQSLMEVVPGATIQRNEAANGEANSTAGSPQRSISFSANGVSGIINQTRIDGSPVTYIWLPTNTAYVPSAEAIEEVSISTNSFNADQGLAGGAAINVVVKSGTNALHGTVWGYDTSSHFTARNVFQTTPGVPKNIVAQFGGNLGGPVVKDKLFFFANGERTTQRVGAGVGTASIVPADLRPTGGAVHFPTPAENSTYGAIIYDPLSSADPTQRRPFDGNTIPADRIDAAARYLAARLPGATGTGYSGNVTTKGATRYNRTNWDFKLNYAASSKLTMFARYGNSPHVIEDQYALGEAGGPAAGGGQVGRSPGRTQVLGAGLTYTFTPTLMLDANFGHTHQVLGSEAPDIDTKIGSDTDKMAIPGTNGPDRLQGGLPSFAFANNTWTSLGNSNTGNPFQFRDNQYTASINLQKTMGAHLFRGGVEYQNAQMNHWQPQGGAFQTVRGSFQFNGNATSLQNAPAPSSLWLNSWADFLLGMPSGAGKVDQLVNPNSIYWKTYSAYLQDTWQVTKALTVSAGLRYESYAFPYRPNGRGVNRFDPEDGYIYIGGVGSTPQDTGATGSGRLLPRAGIAYRINQKTVIRAGFGQSADPTGYFQFRDSYPTVNIWSMPQIAYNGTANPYIPVTTLRQGLVNPNTGLDISSGRIRLPANTGTTTYPKNGERKYINSWNIAVQRELAPWLTTQVAYVGTRAVGQMNFVNINAGAPGTGDAGRPLNIKGFTTGGVNINSVQPYGDTKYDGLQAELRVRSNSAQAGLAYTYSKTTNYADNMVGNAAGAGSPRIQYMQEKEKNKGLAGYGRKHVLQMYWVWDLPFGKDKKGLAGALLGGWQINGLFSDMSGTPIYVIQGSGYNLQAAGSAQIPDLTGNISVNRDVLVNVGGNVPAGANPADYQFFSVGSFREVNIPSGQAQRFGNNERNDVPGPNYWNVDLGIFRTIGLPGPAKLQLRAEALNVFNHPNYRSPGSQWIGGNDVSNASQFGKITSLTGTSSRNIRFAVRLWF